MTQPYKPGDIILTHRKGFIPKMITVTQGLRYSKEYAHWSHVGIFVEDGIVEALTRGVIKSRCDKYDHLDFKIIDVRATDAQRELVCTYANHLVGWKYGFIADLSLFITLLTKSKLAVAEDGQIFCSGLAAEALCRTTAIFPKTPSRMLPADLAMYYA